MRRNACRFTLVALAAADVVTGCSRLSDPLGGPHGGSLGAVPPDDGNAGPAEDTLDAEADDALTVDATPGAADDGAGDPTPGVIGWSDAGVAAVSTWSRIFDDYLASGTVGNCAQCHAAMMSASNGYAFAKVARMESRFVAMALALARARSNMAFDPP